jgi:hypothetical protein
VHADMGPSMSAIAAMDTTPAELADALDRLLTEIVALLPLYPRYPT